MFVSLGATSMEQQGSRQTVQFGAVMMRRNLHSEEVVMREKRMRLEGFMFSEAAGSAPAAVQDVAAWAFKPEAAGQFFSVPYDIYRGARRVTERLWSRRERDSSDHSPFVQKSYFR